MSEIQTFGINVAQYLNHFHGKSDVFMKQHYRSQVSQVQRRLNGRLTASARAYNEDRLAWLLANLME